MIASCGQWSDSIFPIQFRINSVCWTSLVDLYSLWNYLLILKKNQLCNYAGIAFELDLCNKIRCLTHTQTLIHMYTITIRRMNQSNQRNNSIRRYYSVIRMWSVVQCGSAFVNFTQWCILIFDMMTPSILDDDLMVHTFNGRCAWSQL